MYTLIKHVKADPVRRAAFNQLAVHIFDLDFEPWYQNGFWNEMYIPYTFFDGYRAIANVSVNRSCLSGPEADPQAADAVIWDIFASGKTDPRQLAAELGSGIKTITLAFTPEGADGYEISPWKDEDLTLFMKGGIIEDLKGRKTRFPGLAHA